jgi:hypothetical protein
VAAFYFFYQPVPESAWELQLASERTNIERTVKPAFVTVLDLDNSFSGEVNGDDVFKIRYRGPFYADFDSQSLDEVIPAFKRFLGKLKGQGVNLEECKLYATGGKGFHVEVPYRVFVEKRIHADVAMLPLIYKELAQELFVDTLDLRVYSARKGRMWRTEGVQRPNGKYKVRITVDEARDITPEKYLELCSAPRHLPEPPEPTFSSSMALLYQQCKEKYEGGAAKRKASVKSNSELKSRYGGNWPPLVKKVFSGQGINPDAGFQKIATQLAITAHALDMKEPDLIGAAEELIQNHVSDGTRYNTPEKRKRELSRMFWYMDQNPSYAYSAPGIKSLLVKDEAQDEAQDENEDQEDFGVTRGFRVTSQGMFAPKDGDEIKVSALGMDSPVRLIDLVENITVGYDVEVFLSGRSIGHHMLHMDRLSSKLSFQRWTMEKASASVQATDNQVAAIADILRMRSAKDGQAMYIVVREGLDIVKLPVREGEEPETDVIWVSKDTVLSRNGNQYRWKNTMNGNGIGSDLHHAPRMEDDAESRAFMDGLFGINSRHNVALLLGWHAAAMISSMIRHLVKEFPTLHIFGQAGSGKTKTLEVFGNLFYYHKSPQIMQATGSTPFSFLAFITGSSSIPIVIDEYKPRDMKPGAASFVRTTLINSNFTGHAVNRGQLGNDAGDKGTRVVAYENAAPLVVVGEAQETTTSVVERTIIVPLTKETRERDPRIARTFEEVYPHRMLLARMGRVLLDEALYNLDLKDLENLIYHCRKVIRDEVVASRGSAEGFDRPINNFATVMAGLTLFKSALRKVFGDRYDAQMDEFSALVIQNSSSGVASTGKRSEASKVLNTLAMMTYADDEALRLVEGRDYTVDATYTDLSLRACYAKYARYQRAHGMEVLFDNDDAFQAAMRQYAGLHDRDPDNDILRYDPIVEVYRFSNAYLDKESVQYFKGR